MKSRGVLIAGNWKMNHGPKAAGQFLSDLASQGARTWDRMRAGSPVRACVIPPAVSLPLVVEQARLLRLPVEVGAQNAHWEKSGAFTGELSGPMLQEVGVTTVLTGHSERRQFFGETDETVRKRTESLLA